MHKSDPRFDWRMQGVTTLAKDVPAAYPGGPSHKAGDPVYTSMLTRNAQGDLIGFISPSPSALAFDIALKAGEEASRQRKTLAFHKGVTPWGEGKNVATENSSILFDFFESCMISVTFSMQSLEVFSNSIIADELKKRTMPVNIKKKTRYMNAIEIQENISVTRKLDEILPTVLKIDSPAKNKILWTNFLELKRIRNTTIHMKASDSHSGSDIDRETLFFEFFRTDPRIFPKYALDICNYFAPRVRNPRWIKAANDLMAMED